MNAGRGNIVTSRGPNVFLSSSMMKSLPKMKASSLFCDISVALTEILPNCGFRRIYFSPFRGKIITLGER